MVRINGIGVGQAPVSKCLTPGSYNVSVEGGRNAIQVTLSTGDNVNLDISQFRVADQPVQTGKSVSRSPVQEGQSNSLLPTSIDASLADSSQFQPIPLDPGQCDPLCAKMGVESSLVLGESAVVLARSCVKKCEAADPELLRCLTHASSNSDFAECATQVGQLGRKQRTPSSRKSRCARFGVAVASLKGTHAIDEARSCLGKFDAGDKVFMDCIKDANTEDAFQKCR